MNSNEYKDYHEAFMANHHGSSAVHTFFCIFFTVVCCIISSLRQKKTGNIQYIHEYMYIVLPMIMAHTLLSDYIYHLNVIALLIFIYEFRKQDKNITGSLKKLNICKAKTIQSISCLRGLTYLITVFSILAVDFKDFPRYLAKTENYGYSLMDTGVGLFVLMSGLVHKNFGNETVKTIVKSHLKLLIILIFLGLTRLVALKQLNYQEHITEYGVHWNFFFTLATCKLFSTFLLHVKNEPFLLTITTMTVHELVLYKGLQHWVFSELPRNDFISANREGLCSSLGYISLYLFGVHIKTIISDKTKYRFTVLNKLFIAAISLSLLTYSVNILRPASRTLANAAYCLFLQTVLCTVLTLLYFLEVLSQDECDEFHFDIPIILKDFNMNGLAYFIISNVMTGVINISMMTLYMPSYMTFIILNIYMMLNISFAVIITKKGYRI
ncbi:hypothetical protein K1T71_002869 [Dendrolimus kikuchii]|uniref:Uncharacterized protein n=1 Tax=Dendrolimus kikuchii TaxID=765133 RepID=A0ACC1DE21_9NEOP|nr:hypothetical protein K1T71_002869 [Dendrolimus kikuchii]